jgi:hypothetical protein
VGITASLTSYLGFSIAGLASCNNVTVNSFSENMLELSPGLVRSPVEEAEVHILEAEVWDLSHISF